MVNNLKQFIYRTSLDVANECIKRIKEKIIVKEPKIIKKKIISSSGFNCSPIMKKYSSSDKLINSVSDYQKISEINNGQSKIKIKKKSNININKPKFNITNAKKSCILLNNINLKNGEDKIYYKKNYNFNNNNIHPSSSTSLITESNVNNENNDKRDLFYIYNWFHRDVKSSNILLDKYGAFRLGDFGVSTIIKEEGKCNNTYVEVFVGWHQK